MRTNHRGLPFLVRTGRVRQSDLPAYTYVSHLHRMGEARIEFLHAADGEFWPAAERAIGEEQRGGNYAVKTIERVVAVLPLARPFTGPGPRTWALETWDRIAIWAVVSEHARIGETTQRGVT